MALAEILKLLREQNGLTQRQIAEKLSIDRSTYTYYELDKTRPDLDTLVKLARIYRVTTDYLLGYEGPVSNVVRAPEPTYRSKNVKVRHLSELARDEQDVILYYRLLTDPKEMLSKLRAAYRAQVEKRESSQRADGSHPADTE